MVSGKRLLTILHGRWYDGDVTPRRRHRRRVLLPVVAVEGTKNPCKSVGARASPEGVESLLPGHAPSQLLLR